MTFDRKTLYRFIELILVLVLSQYFTTWVGLAAKSVGIDLPQMPLLRRTYLFFLFIMLVFVWVRLRGEKLSEFGLVMPRSWLTVIGHALLIFVVIMTFDSIARPLIDPWVAKITGSGTHMAEQYFASLKGNVGLLLWMLPSGWLFGGLGEEMLFRGYIMTRIAQILGDGRGAWIAALFLQGIPFALGHAYQGPVGMLAVYVAALVFGAGTLIWGRNLWPAIIAHGLQDTVGFLALFAGVAHG